MIAKPRTGSWIVERVLTALAVGGLLSAVIAVGLTLAWAGQ